jgi:hypothetical protein
VVLGSVEELKELAGVDGIMIGVLLAGSGSRVVWLLLMAGVKRRGRPTGAVLPWDVDFCFSPAWVLEKLKVGRLANDLVWLLKLLACMLSDLYSRETQC